MKLLLLSAFLAVCHAGVVQRPELCCGWTVSSQLGDSLVAPVKFTLSVREQNIEKLRQIVESISDPASTEYGEYMTSAQVERMTRPLPEDVAVVTSWLEVS